jgi:hypothetical protein
MSEEEEVVSTDTSVDTSVESASPETEADAEIQGSEAESTPAVEPDDKEKSNSFGERIKELTDKVRTGETRSAAQIFEQRQEIERLNAELKSRPKPTEPLKTLEDFEFNEAKFDEYKDQRTATIAEEAASTAVGKARTQIESGQIDQEFRTRETTFESEVSDYEDVVYGEVNGQRKWAASPTMTDELRFSEIGPEMAYHLAKNPEIASEIASLSNRETVRRMTLLEASLKSEKAKKGKSVSDAPPPTPKIPAGDAGLEKKITDPDLSNKEFDKMRRKQIANR